MPVYFSDGPNGRADSVSTLMNTTGHVINLNQ